MPKDNTSLAFKVARRRELCKTLGHAPTVLEAYGGFGILYGRAYREVKASGAVIEKDLAKAQHLARQRPNWIVARGDCGPLIGAGFCNWIAFDILDADAWGSPWEPVLAFLESERERANPFYILATDGLGYKLRLGAGVKVLQAYVERYGEKTVRREYEKIARELLEDGSFTGGMEGQGLAISRGRPARALAGEARAVMPARFSLVLAGAGYASDRDRAHRADPAGNRRGRV